MAHRLNLRRFAVPLALIALMLAGAWIRLWGIGAWRMSVDDAYIQALASIPPLLHPDFSYSNTPLVWITAAFMPRQHWWNLLTITPVSGHPAFFYLLLHFMMHWTDNPLYLRSLSIIPGLAAIPIAYLLGRKTSGVLSGLMAALLLTFSDIHIVFSQEIRSYALFVFLMSLTVLSILNFDSTRKKIWLAGYFLCGFLALFTNYGAAILITCIGLTGIGRNLRGHRGDIRALMKDGGFIGWCALHGLMAAFYFWQSNVFMWAVGNLHAASTTSWSGVPYSVHILLSLLKVTEMPGLLFFDNGSYFYMLTGIMFAFGLWALYQDAKYEWFAVGAGSFTLTWLLVLLEMHPYYAVRHFSHLFPVLLITCSYPFSRSIRIDGVKVAAVFVALFLVFFAFNLFGPGGNGLNPDLYRISMLGKCDRLYDARQSDWNNLQQALNSQAAPEDVLVTDQTDWLLYAWEAHLGSLSMRLFTDRRYYVCTDAIRLYHISGRVGAKTFNRCMYNAALAYPKAKHLWYIFSDRLAHNKTYEGICLMDFPQSVQLKKAAVRQLEFSTVGAYALSRQAVLAHPAIIEPPDPEQLLTLQPRKQCGP